MQNLVGRPRWLIRHAFIGFRYKKRSELSTEKVLFQDRPVKFYF